MGGFYGTTVLRVFSMKHFNGQNNVFSDHFYMILFIPSKYLSWSRCLEDVLIKTICSPWSHVFRRRLQYVLIETNIFVLAIRLQDVIRTSCKNVFKTSSRRLQDILKMSWKDVLPRRLQDLFKKSCKNVFKASSTNLQDILKTSDILQRCLCFIFFLFIIIFFIKILFILGLEH